MGLGMQWDWGDTAGLGEECKVRWMQQGQGDAVGLDRTGGTQQGLGGVTAGSGRCSRAGEDTQPRGSPCTPPSTSRASHMEHTGPDLAPWGTEGCLVPLQRLLAPAGTLHADKKPQDSRFGYALAAVPDLNHDGFNDVVVGAPLEDGHRGAVYVYHGAPGTLLPNYKQVRWDRGGLGGLAAIWVGALLG